MESDVIVNYEGNETHQPINGVTVLPTPWKSCLKKKKKKNSLEIVSKKKKKTKLLGNPQELSPLN